MSAHERSLVSAFGVVSYCVVEAHVVRAAHSRSEVVEYSFVRYWLS
jgi:hypothetical protein